MNEQKPTEKRPANQERMRAAFRELGSLKPYPKIKEPVRFQFSDMHVMRLLERGELSVHEDVEELVILIASVRDVFSVDPPHADKDAVWQLAMERYAKQFGGPHRFLPVKVMRQVFDAIVVDVLSRSVYVDR